MDTAMQPKLMNVLYISNSTCAHHETRTTNKYIAAVSALATAPSAETRLTGFSRDQRCHDEAAREP